MIVRFNELMEISLCKEFSINFDEFFKTSLDLFICLKKRTSTKHLYGKYHTNDQVIIQI